MIEYREVTLYFSYDRVFEITGDSQKEVNDFVNSTVDNIHPVYFPSIQHHALPQIDDDGEKTGKWIARYSFAKKC